MATIEEIFVPNIVPYDAQGRTNEDKLRRIIRWRGGAEAIVQNPCGKDLSCLT